MHIFIKLKITKMQKYFLLLAVCYFSCNNSNNSNDSNFNPPNVVNDNYKDSINKVENEAKRISDSLVLADKSSWIYSNETDELTNKQTYFAAVDANELLQFQPPYDGGTTVTLTIRNRRGKDEVILGISKGQFLSNIGSNRDIKVKFDDSKVLKFGYRDPADYSSTYIFIDNANSFISKLKKSKNLIIECTFYNEGAQIVHFDVNKFSWNH